MGLRCGRIRCRAGRAARRPRRTGRARPRRPSRRAPAAAVRRAGRRSARAACPARSPRSRRRPARSPAAAQLAVLGQPGPVLVERRDDLVDALAARGDRLARSAAASRPAPRSPRRDHALDVADGGVGAVPVGLVDHEDVGDLQDAGLGRLDRVAHARARAAPAWCRPARRSPPRPGRRRRSRPGPRRSRRASSTRSACGVAAASPPRCPRVAIDRMKTPGSVAWSCIRTRSPSSAPPENGADGSTASTPTRCPRPRSARTSVVGRWSTCRRPGEPVRPIDLGLPGVRRERRRHLAQLRRRRPRPARSAGPPPAGRRPGPRATSVGDVAACAGLGVDGGSRVSAGAGTRRISASPWPPPPHSAAAPSAAAAPLQLQREVQREPGAGHADRVAERDRAAVDVDDVRARRRGRASTGCRPRRTPR